MPADASQALKPRPSPGPVDRAAAARLESELQRTTKAEVRFDGGSRALYATDGSLYRQVPIGVVIPRSVDDVMSTLAACRAHDAPVLMRGGGTSLPGQCCNVAVIIGWSKYSTGIAAIEAKHNPPPSPP